MSENGSEPEQTSDTDRPTKNGKIAFYPPIFLSNITSPF